MMKAFALLALIGARLLTRTEGEDAPAHASTLSQRQRILRKTPDTRAHPGIVDLPLPEANTTLHLIRCRNYASAYSAAWLAPRDYVLRTSYANRATLEWHSHNLYQANEAASYKIEEYDTFFVNHISEYEHYVMRHGVGKSSSSGGGGGAGGKGQGVLSKQGAASVAEMVASEQARTCSLPNGSGGGSPRVRSKRHAETAGIIPFYPGAVGNSNMTGNAHSVSSMAAKATWLRAVACSLAPFMKSVVVGTCSKDHAHLARQALGLLRDDDGDPSPGPHSTPTASDPTPPPTPPWAFPSTFVEVVEFNCDQLPVHLPYVLLRHAQARLKTAAAAAAAARTGSGGGVGSRRRRRELLRNHRGPAALPSPAAMVADGSQPSPRQASAWKGVKYLYFSEMDNALHVSDMAATATTSTTSSTASGLLWDSVLQFIDGKHGATGYVSPNRFNKKGGSGGPGKIGPKDFVLSGQNKCARD